MSLIPDSSVIQKMLNALPIVTYQAGEHVLTAGSRTGRLLILEKGAVAIIKGGVTTSDWKILIPVRLPPGRARLATRPSLTGSSAATKPALPMPYLNAPR